MDRLEIVVDTNVFFAGLHSRRGSAHWLLQEIGKNSAFRVHLSVPLVLEYEEVAKRRARALGLTFQDIEDILDYLCSVAGLHSIFYLWRPFLPDADDDMLLELAVEAGCSRIVTFNCKDFRGVDRFGIVAMTPAEILKEIGATR